MELLMNLSSLARFGLPVLGLSTLLACSSSSSSGETTPDAASTADSHAPTQDAGVGADSASATDSGTAPDTTAPNPAQDSGAPDPTLDSSIPDSSPPADAAVLSFATDLYPVVQQHCIFCHGPTADGGEGSGEAFGKLDMSSVDAGYANLVGVPAEGAACAADGGPVRVVPGNAAESLLYLKVNGFNTPPPCGGAMPKSGEIPDGGQAVLVEQVQTWINQGAKP
jgi:mono/diheme cytochrome c family protein